MMLCKWEKLPQEMQTEEVRRYYDILSKKKCSLFFKRLFDVVVSAIGLVVFSPVFLALAIAIKVDSPGSVFYRQKRVTQYGKCFHIFKFRTMVSNADKIGSQVTIKGDSRITRVGSFIRKYRLDEISQFIDVFRGTMTFVATRPESLEYIKHYTPEMFATLLIPAGVTNLASIFYKDEAELLEKAEDADKVYIEEILPKKMYYNLKYIEEFSLLNDFLTMIKTVLAVLGKDYTAGSATLDVDLKIENTNL